MNELSVHIITQSKDLPIVEGNDLFHSRERFLLIEQTAGTWPYMVVVTDEEGRVKAHLLAELRRRGSLLPPYLFTFARVIGAGVYAPGVDKAALFDRMMGALTRFLHRKLCLYIEVSDLEKKMFGYRSLRHNGYFPIRWMQIHNSLHSRTPRERLSDRTAHNVLRSERAGVTVHEARTELEVSAYYKVLHAYYRTKLHRYLPGEDFFQRLLHTPRAHILVAYVQGACGRRSVGHGVEGRRLSLVHSSAGQTLPDGTAANGHCLACAGILSCPETQTCILSQRRAAVSPQPLPRIHTWLRWQAHLDLPLVPLHDRMVQPYSLLVLQGVRFTVCIGCFLVHQEDCNKVHQIASHQL